MGDNDPARISEKSVRIISHIRESALSVKNQQLCLGAGDKYVENMTELLHVLFEGDGILLHEIIKEVVGAIVTFFRAEKYYSIISTATLELCMREAVAALLDVRLMGFTGAAVHGSISATVQCVNKVRSGQLSILRLLAKPSSLSMYSPSSLLRSWLRRHLSRHLCWHFYHCRGAQYRPQVKAEPKRQECTRNSSARLWVRSARRTQLIHSAGLGLTLFSCPSTSFYK